MKTTMLVMAISLLLLGCLQSSAPGSVTNRTDFNDTASSSLPIANASPSTSPSRIVPNLTISERLFDDDIRLGSDTAPIVIIEFADFQCPFSRRWWQDSFRLLERDYIEPGAVQFVYRDFPLHSHPTAPLAAQAAECARAQGQWRPMYDFIFREQTYFGDGVVAFGREDIDRWAGRINDLNTTLFGQCLDNQTYRDEVYEDVRDGILAGVDATPTFIIGKRNQTGERIEGAVSYSVLQDKIRALLEP